MKFLKVLQSIILVLCLIIIITAASIFMNILNPMGKATVLSSISIAILEGKFEDVKYDYNNGCYNIFNSDESIAVNARVSAFYKGATVVKQNLIGTCSIFQTIWLNDGYISSQDLNHEYGHSIQETILGYRYISRVAIPSASYYFYDIISDSTPYDYYSTPWERMADWFGRVERDYGYKNNSLLWGFAENFIGPIVIPFYFIFGYSI